MVSAALQIYHRFLGVSFTVLFCLKLLIIAFSYFTYAILVKILWFSVPKSMKFMDGTGVECKNRKPVKAYRKPSGRLKRKRKADFGYVLKWQRGKTYLPYIWENLINLFKCSSRICILYGTTLVTKSITFIFKIWFACMLFAWSHLGPSMLIVQN